MKITGTIKSIGETETFGNNGFQKRELVITTNDQYPQTLPVEFAKDKTALLDNLQEGQSVTVNVNLRGREWVSPQGEVKHFISLQGWKIE